MVKLWRQITPRKEKFTITLHIKGRKERTLALITGTIIDAELHDYGRFLKLNFKFYYRQLWYNVTAFREFWIEKPNLGYSLVMKQFSTVDKQSTLPDFISQAPLNTSE